MCYAVRAAHGIITMDESGPRPSPTLSTGRARGAQRSSHVRDSSELDIHSSLRSRSAGARLCSRKTAAVSASSKTGAAAAHNPTPSFAQATSSSRRMQELGKQTRRVYVHGIRAKAVPHSATLACGSSAVIRRNVQGQRPSRREHERWSAAGLRDSDFVSEVSVEDFRLAGGESTELRLRTNPIQLRAQRKLHRSPKMGMDPAQAKLLFGGGDGGEKQRCRREERAWVSSLR